MRVVIAEDAVLLREGLTRLMAEFGHEVVASLADATELSDAVDRLTPDVVVTDVRMPPTNRDEGVRAAIELRAARPGFPVVLLSQYVEERYATELIAGDASGLGYLLKERVADVRPSSNRWSGWPMAAPPSTPRWCRSSWSGPARTRWPPSPPGSGRRWG